MNEPHISHLIRQNLNRSTRVLPAGVLARLKSARMNALARQKRTVYSPVLAALGARFDTDFGSLPRAIGSYLAVGLIVFTCLSYWHGQHYIAGLEEVDSAILIDDLPLDAFVDSGFDAWLHASSER